MGISFGALGGNMKGFGLTSKSADFGFDSGLDTSRVCALFESQTWH